MGKPLIPPTIEQDLAEVRRDLRRFLTTRASTTGFADLEDTLRVSVGEQPDNSFDLVLYDDAGVEIWRATNTYTRDEVDALLAAITGDISSLTSALAAETAARIAADSALQGAIDDEEAARIAADTYFADVDEALEVWIEAVEGDLEDMQSVSVRKFVGRFGNASDTVYVVTHNLGTKDVCVTVIDNSTDNVLGSDWQATSVNTVTITLAAPPGVDALRAVVMG